MTVHAGNLRATHEAVAGLRSPLDGVLGDQGLVGVEVEASERIEER